MKYEVYSCFFCKLVSHFPLYMCYIYSPDAAYADIPRRYSFVLGGCRGAVAVAVAGQERLTTRFTLFSTPLLEEVVEGPLLFLQLHYVSCTNPKCVTEVRTELHTAL